MDGGEEEQQPITERWFISAFVSSVPCATADQPRALCEERAAEVLAEEEDEDGSRFALQLYSWAGEETALAVLGLLCLDLDSNFIFNVTNALFGYL